VGGGGGSFDVSDHTKERGRFPRVDRLVQFKTWEKKGEYLGAEREPKYKK